MASSPRKNQSGNYFITWSDSGREQRQKTESLQTKKLGEARGRKSALETLYNNGYHDPWEAPWHQNNKIKGFVRSGIIDLQKLSRGSVTPISTREAIRKYINYKRDYGVWSYSSAQHIGNALRRAQKKLPTELSDITTESLHKFLSGKSGVYQKNLMRMLTAFMNWCVDQDYLEQVISYPTPEPKKTVPSTIPNSDLKYACFQWLERCRKVEDYNYKTHGSTRIWIAFGWLVLRLTGMRPGELMYIKTTDVDLDNDRILVGVHRTTKTKAQRYVDIQPEAKSLLTFLLSDKYRLSDPVTKKQPWLLGRSGEMNLNYMRRAWKQVMPKKKMYWLKDTYGFWIIIKSPNPNYNLIYLRDQFGHASIETTNKYLKYAPKSKPELCDFTFLPDFLDKVLLFLHETNLSN